MVGWGGQAGGLSKADKSCFHCWLCHCMHQPHKSAARLHSAAPFPRPAGTWPSRGCTCHKTSQRLGSTFRTQPPTTCPPPSTAWVRVWALARSSLVLLPLLQQSSPLAPITSTSSEATRAVDDARVACAHTVPCHSLALPQACCTSTARAQLSTSPRPASTLSRQRIATTMPHTTWALCIRWVGRAARMLINTGRGLPSLHSCIAEAEAPLCCRAVHKHCTLPLSCHTDLQGGYGVTPNITHAIQLFRNATDLGSWRAPHQLMLVRIGALGGGGQVLNVDEGHHHPTCGAKLAGGQPPATSPSPSLCRRPPLTCRSWLTGCMVRQRTCGARCTPFGASCP